LSDQLNARQSKLNFQIETLKDSVNSKQNNLNVLSNKYSKLENDKTLLATKMKELEKAIGPQLESDETTRVIFSDILKILDESLGGFNAGAMLLLFGN
jgi:predicted  nucleic acid-binding Zn-ribbon protein